MYNYTKTHRVSMPETQLTGDQISKISAFIVGCTWFAGCAFGSQLQVGFLPRCQPHADTMLKRVVIVAADKGMAGE